MDRENKIINLQEKLIQKFIEEKRPPQEIRAQLDIGYSFENGIVEIFEIRPNWMNQNDKKKIHIPVAKSKYIKSRNIWKIFWKRANGKWEGYKPNEEVKDISDFLKIVGEDKLGCFGDKSSIPSPPLTPHSLSSPSYLPYFEHSAFYSH